MLSALHPTLLRVAGAAAGIAAAVALLVAARPGGAMSALPASVAFSLAPPGTLAATPAPPATLLEAKRLEPGGRDASAGFWLRNQSGLTLHVGFRAKPDSRSLDGLVRVRITSGGLILADTTLQGLRRGTAVMLPIRSGAARHLRLQAWIPGAVTDGYQGRIVKIMLSVTAERAGGGA